MRKIFLLVLLFVTTSLSAQFNEAILHFRDGSIKKGFAKHPFASIKLKFKENEESNSQIFTYKQVDKFFFITYKKGKEIKTEYEYKLSPKQITPKLVEVYIRGKISLYGIEKQHTSVGMPMGGFGGNSGVGFSMGIGGSSTTYYLGKEDSDIIEKITSRESFNFKRFKKIVLKHFKDCKLLVEKTKKKKKYLKKETMFSIVEFYNKNCNN
ncbi:MAG: hypothetical protein ACPGUU_03390 [Flavobacteriaceae bacterium]